jgi:NAD(P)-dependent dehydrogenase (short-subunit alcohol dehydrogenase family)
MTQSALALETVRAGMLAATPLGRFGKADEIAAVVAFLCSADASFITGAYYLVDGGIVLQ